MTSQILQQVCISRSPNCTVPDKTGYNYRSCGHAHCKCCWTVGKVTATHTQSSVHFKNGRSTSSEAVAASFCEFDPVLLRTTLWSLVALPVFMRVRVDSHIVSGHWKSRLGEGSFVAALVKNIQACSSGFNWEERKETLGMKEVLCLLCLIQSCMAENRGVSF